MRIIGGKYKGRPIKSAKGLPVRPTTDRTREALFNILNHRIDWSESSILDLFAGTGAVGLECLSRGAKAVHAVDKHRKCIQSIRAMAIDLKVEDSIRFTQSDALAFARKHQESYDLIFMDPPYAWEKYTSLITLMMEGMLLRPGGLLIVEHNPKQDYSHINGFESRREYGSSGISFFEKDEV